MLTGKSFVRNRCPVRAAALSYATLLAIIPMLAVAISVTSSLLKSEGEEKIYAAIDKVISNLMPPATTSSDGHGVLLNMSPVIIPVIPTNAVIFKTATNAVTDTNAIAGTLENFGHDMPVVSVNAQKEAAKDIHKFIQNTESSKLGLIGTCCSSWSSPSGCWRTSRKRSTTSGA